MNRSKMCNLSLVAMIKRGDIEGATDFLLVEAPSADELRVQDNGDGDALFWASCRGYLLVVELLLTLGADVSATSLASGATPLHGAVDNNHSDVTRLLLKWGSDVRSRNKYQDTPCHLAAYRGNSQCVALLLKAGANTQSKNSRNNTVLDEAKYGQLVESRGDHTLVQHLIYSSEHCGTYDEDTLDSLNDRTDSDHFSYLGRRYRRPKSHPNQDTTNRVFRNGAEH